MNSLMANPPVCANIERLEILLAVESFAGASERFAPLSYPAHIACFYNA